MFPEEIIEGASVTVRCDQGFRIEGDWLLECHNGSLNSDAIDMFPKCVPINIGKIIIISSVYEYHGI